MTPGFFFFFSFRNNYSLDGDLHQLTRKEKQNRPLGEVDFRAVDGEHTHMVYGWTLAPPDIWIETFQGGEGNFGEFVKVGNQG